MNETLQTIQKEYSDLKKAEDEAAEAAAATQASGPVATLPESV